MDNDSEHVETPKDVEKSTIDEIAGGDMPEVKQNAIDAVNLQKDNEIKKAVEVDGFNPDIHVVGADGQPQRNKNGSLKKKRGRKKGATNSTLNLKSEAPKDEALPTMGSDEAATVISGLLEAAQVKLVSEEFIYSELERIGNIEAWRQTLDHYGGVKLSPPQALALSHLQIIVVRAMTQENKKTQEKFKLFGTWVKFKMSKITFKKKGKKDGARSDSGEDSKRENDTSNANGKGKAKGGD